MSRPPTKDINEIVAAAQALGFEGPIADYRILGDRIELWDLHGRTAVYYPGLAPHAPAEMEIDLAPQEPKRKGKRSKNK